MERKTSPDTKLEGNTPPHIERETPPNHKLEEKVTPNTKEAETTERIVKTTAPEEQSPTSGAEAGSFYQVGKMKEMKSCHRLDVPKRMLESIQDSPRPAHNADVRAFDRQGDNP